MGVLPGCLQRPALPPFSFHFQARMSQELRGPLLSFPMAQCAETAGHGSGLSLGPDVFHWTNSLVWLDRSSTEQRYICSGGNGAEF